MKKKIKKIYCEVCKKEQECIFKEQCKEEVIKNFKIKYLERNYFCSSCDNEVYDKDCFNYNINAANDELRKQTNLIRTSEIEEILEKYNIGKKPLSLMLGFGEIQIIRYLKSGNPSKEHSDILKNILNNPFIFETYLVSYKDKLTEIAYKKSLGKVRQLELSSVHSDIYKVGTYLINKYDDITNMSLQKILYFLNGFSELFLNKKLFNEVSESWKLGPVYRDMYDAFSYYQKSNIDYNEIVKDNFELDNNIKEYVDKVSKYFACYSGHKLMQMTHLTDPWKIAREGLDDNESSNRVINEDDIDKYFKKIAKDYNIKEYSDIEKYAQDLCRLSDIEGTI